MLFIFLHLSIHVSGTIHTWNRGLTTQSAFITGPLITDNIMIAFKFTHCLKQKRRGKHGVAGLKIDMAKAYDRIEWSYLKVMLVAMGFDTTWISRVMTCVSTVKHCVLMHGKVVGPIQPQRGLRQGDPLSPYLFIRCAEGLSALLQKNEAIGLIHGC